MTTLPTLGTDPEIVTVATSVDHLRRLGLPEQLVGMPMPAYYALEVQNARHPEIMLPYGTLMPDGMAAEFTVKPTNSVDQMIEQIRANLRGTRDIAARTGCILRVDPNFHTDPLYIDRLPKSYCDACSLQILGCAPDVCIYSDVTLPERPDPRFYPFRTSGGHIHLEVGSSFLADYAAMCYTVAALDAVLGTATTYLCTSEQAYARKKLYGSAGMIRTNAKLGTIEYRTLSAQGLLQTETLARMMFTGAQAIVGHMLDIYAAMPQPDAIKYYMDLLGNYGTLVNELVPAINAHDVDACRAYQERVAMRLSEHVILSDSIQQMQTYKMPEDFDLHWEL